ncbi:MAG TPA: hypothetical protein VL728_12715 [Cyclobacteriaceae bacterium]|jgi:hypothetical protein|nr:hypothetical protein [Cyclobacteriaceae bacterium]
MRPRLSYYFFFIAAMLVAANAGAQDSLANQKIRAVDSTAKSSANRVTRAAALPIDTLKKLDSAIHYQNQSLNSLQKNFKHRTDSLQHAFASPMSKMQTSLARLNHKKDSLTKLHLPTSSVTHKIDSVQRAQTAKLNELNGKVAQLKKETLSKASALNLPPEAQKELTTFTGAIDKFKVPNNFFQLPAFKMAGLSNFGIPSNFASLKLPSNLSIPQVNIPSLQKLDIKSMQIPSLSQLQGSLGSEIKKLQSLKSIDAKGIEKEAMNVAGQNSEVKSILKEETQVKDIQKQLSQIKNAKNIDSMAMKQLQPAVNHFAGKEKELTAAMDKVSKLKQKYSSVKSLSDLPKRAPNPLRDKPWIERIVPGLNYFVINRNYTLVDFNPYMGWRFNPRFTAALGWNERIGIAHGRFRTRQFDRVFGLRATASYSWTHGINFKIAPELMNAWVPTNTPDVKNNAWVFGFYAGVRKDFPIYKSLKGYSEVIYNFTQKPYQNIYGDPVSFRFGMELKLKAKPKKKGVGMVNPSSLKNSTQPRDSFRIVRKEKLFGVVGIKGDTLVPAKYQLIKKFLSDGRLYFVVKKDKKFGALSSDGKEAVPVSHPAAALVKLELINRVRSKYQLDKMTNVK